MQIQPQDEFLYIRIADRLQTQIEQQVLKTGDKLPSVRALSKEQGVSLTTAFQAYSELEIKGLIEARPKSGYYVRFTPSAFPRVMARKAHEKPKKVSVESVATLVYQKMRQEGTIKFSQAVPSIDLLPTAKLTKSMIEAIRKSPGSCMEYEDTQGNARLRQQLARQTMSWGRQITADDIITTQGCMEALVFCLKAVTEPGDTVAIESPTYFGIFNVLQNLGLKALEVPVHPTTGLDITYLQRALETVKIKACLFVTCFNNPTGCDMSDENRQQLVAILSSKEIPLIEDNIYGEMYFGKMRPIPCKAYDTKGLVLLCSSISKTLAPGYRIGWCIPGKFMDKVIYQKLMNSVSSATPTQAAVAHFLETGRYDLHMRNLRKALHTQRMLYTQAIAQHFPPDTKISCPGGGCVLWVEMNTSIDAMDVFHEALEHGISIAPGQLFSADGRFKHHIRISFGATYNAMIEQSLKTLGQLVWKKVK